MFIKPWFVLSSYNLNFSFETDISERFPIMKYSLTM